MRSLLLMLAGVAGLGLVAALLSGTYSAFAIAFVGGVLTLLSPCSAVMLPAFFAYSFKQPQKIVLMTSVFWLGLASLFVPLGFTGALLSHWLLSNLSTITFVSGILFVLFGLLALRSRPIWPVRGGALGVSSSGREYATVYSMGFMFAFTTGTCMAPIIGGIYTLTLTTTYWWYPALLLMVYSLGLVLPLFVLALWGEKNDWYSHPLVLGKEILIPFYSKVYRVHSTKLITAVLFIIIGCVFIFSHGTYGLLGGYGASGMANVYLSLNEWAMKYDTITTLVSSVAVGSLGWFLFTRKF